MKFSGLPPLLAPLDGGIFCGLTTDKAGAHHAVVLLPGRGEDITWKKAIAWADKVGGVLPTRPVSALLFATAKDHIEPGWYWTSEEFDGSSAWYQGFISGLQNGVLKSYVGRAVAVRLIQLTA